MTIDKRFPALKNMRQQLQADASSLRRTVLQMQARGEDATGYILQQHDVEAVIQEIDDVFDHFHKQGLLEITPTVAGLMLFSMIASILLLSVLVYTLAGAH
jgi:hypothetical protein